MFFVWGIYDLFQSGILLGLDNKGICQPYMVALGFGLVALLSYLLGSVNFALLISKGVYRDDVRTHGSGNAGTTNMLRTYGKGSAIATFIGDGMKGVIAILLACLLFGGTVPYCKDACFLAAFCTMLGHVFPLFSHFKGGKGFATAALCIIVLNPVLAGILLFVFGPIVLGTHYVSLGSVVTMWFYSVFLSSFEQTFSHTGLSTLLTVCMAILVTYSHRSNIKRLLNGTESKTYIFKKKEKQPMNEKEETDKSFQEETTEENTPTEENK